MTSRLIASRSDSTSHSSEELRRLLAGNLLKVAGFLVTLVLLYAIIVGWRSWIEEKARHVGQLATIADLEAKAIHNYFSGLGISLKNIGEDVAALRDPVDLDQAHRVVKRFWESRPDLFNVALSQPDGKVLLTARTAPSQTKASLGNQASFKEFVAQAGLGRMSAIGRPVTGAVLTRAIVPFRHAVKGADGKLKYIVSASIPLEYLQSYWMDAPIVAKASIGVVRDDGYLLSRYPVPNNVASDEMFASPRSDALVNHLQKRKFPEAGNVEGSSGPGEHDALFVFRRLGYFPATVFIAMPLSEIKATWWERFQGTLYLSVIFIVTGLVAVRYGLRRQRMWQFEQEGIETARRDSERNLSEAQEAGRVGSYVFDIPNDIWKSSPVMDQIFGIDAGFPHTLAGWTQVLHPAEREQMNSYFSKIVAEHLPFDREYRIVRANDGAERWVYGRGRIEYDASGMAVQMVGIIQDITERKQAEEALRSSEDRMRTIIETEPECVKVVNGEGRLVEMNAAGLAMLEAASLAEAQTCPLSEYLLPEHRAAFVDLHRRVMRGETGVLSFEVKGLKGTRRWLETHAAPMRDAAGGVVALLGITRDITERRRTEEELLRQKNLLNTIFESSSEAIFVKDLEGRYCFINETGARMLGHKPGDIIGRTDADLVPAEIARVFRETDEKVVSGGEVYEREEIGVIGDRRFIFQASKTPWRDNSGKIVGVIGISRDVTEHRLVETERARLEAQLRESQKMEALGTLAGGVAHDFNNALAAILGNVELARQDVGPEHPALVSLEEIGKASRRAKDLVQQILAFSRRQKMERKPMSLALVVVETTRLMRASLPAMVSLKANCDGDSPPVLADATQMEQILLNLCGNAAHAVEDTGRPGVIEVNLSAYDCAKGRADGGLPSGRYACLTVSDNGVGMDEETRSRIFDPFFTTKPAGKGTGLGLSVVHGIVQAHEAHIEVDSYPGAGSTFRIYFPAVETQVERIVPPSPSAAPAQGQGKHVLYLDDEEAIIFLMKRLLQRKGYRVSGYTEPRQALAAVRANPGQYDLAVTDYYMPGMSGLEVAQALKEIRPDLPIVMASGYITEDLRAKAPAAGIREVIYKPNTVEDLCEAIARFANTQNAIEGVR